MDKVRGRILQTIYGLGVIALLTGCKHLPPPKPLDQLTPQEQAGRAVFNSECARCHYDREDKPLHGPTLLGLYKQQYLPSGRPANDEMVMHTIQHGRGMMPPVGDRMTPEETAALLAYLHSL